MNQFGLITFISSTENISPDFDNCLLRILETMKIMNIVLPTLKEKKNSYSPFLPICKKTGKGLEVPIKIINKENGIIASKMIIINLLKL